MASFFCFESQNHKNVEFVLANWTKDEARLEKYIFIDHWQWKPMKKVSAGADASEKKCNKYMRSKKSLL
jgi:hypothetical protein